MRLVAIVLALAACQSSDDESPDDDGSPDDTDPADTDDTDPGTDTDTDSDVDTDTDAPEEDICAFTQCGGDVVGAWNLIGSCIDLPVYAGCPTATTEFDIDADGTWTFDAAGTYAIDGTVAFTTTSTYPVECNEYYGYTDCSQYDPYELPTMECTGDAAVLCTCVNTQPPFPFVDSGSWSYTGDDVTLLSDYGSFGKGGGTFPNRFEICRDGDRLDLELDGPFPLGYALEL